MGSLKLKFLVALLVAYPVAFLFTRHMEATHRLDSLGLWYTLFVATFFAVVAALVVVLAASGFARFRSRRFRITRQ